LKALGTIDSTLLIFGGPYGNLAATEAMRSKAKALGISADHIICTGDLVAYCAEPQQTVDLIRDWGIHVVMGNCEESLAMSQMDCGCGFEAGSACSVLSVAWYEYANQHVSRDSRRWMNDLPRSIELQVENHRFRIVHASVTSINQFIFASTPVEAKRRQILEADVDCVIGGHSGIPFGQDIEEMLWLNAGVIGLPANDGSSDGWFMLLEPDDTGFQVSWHRLSYDAKFSHISTKKAGMGEYAQALIDGLWPSMDVLPDQEQSNQGNRLELPDIKVESTQVPVNAG
jgi:predicted phosphodiesterase